jgi:Trk K+ transport system NAD-binding subunit
LIALIMTGVNERISRLRKGRSAVLEANHTLVLGWSPRLPVILSELVQANANHRRAAIVILAERPKDEMEDELRRLLPDARTTRIVCRTGDPSRPADLSLVNVAGARSVIVLADAEGDAAVVKTVLAVRSLDPDFEHTRLVAEMASVHHATTLCSLTDNQIATVQAEQVISQVTAQACHQSGLAGVFRDLLGFDGDDIYITSVPALVGRTYADAQLTFNTSSMMGVCRDDLVTLNPPADFVFAEGDEVIAISADDDTVVLSGIRPVPEVEVSKDEPFEEPPQHIAIVGWSRIGAEVIAELDQVLGDGSTVDLLIEGSHVSDDDVALPRLAHCTANVRVLKHGPDALLEALAKKTYDQAIVLGYRHHMSASKADARTMLTLLAMHKAWADQPQRPRVVAELLDRANIDIAQTIDVDDFIVSDELSSLMLAQVSERIELSAVFHELFTASGAFISLRPAALYAPAHTVSFGSIVASASLRGESALGYRIGKRAVVLNPPKSTRVTLSPSDSVLVLGERIARPSDDPESTIFPARMIPRVSLNGAKLPAPAEPQD